MAACVLMGVVAGNLMATLALFPSCGLVTLIGTMLYLNYLKAIRSIEDGRYFEGKSVVAVLRAPTL